MTSSPRKVARSGRQILTKATGRKKAESTWEPMTEKEFLTILKRHGFKKLTPAESRRYRKILHPQE